MRKYREPYRNNDKLEHDLRRCAGHLDVVPVKGTVHTVRLLFDGHREFLERFNVESALPDNSSKLSGQTPFVILACEECDRLPTFPTSSYHIDQCLIVVCVSVLR